jgi:hypothetical protein
MKPRVSPEHWDGLFRSGTYDDLVAIAALLCGADAFDASAADYGLEAQPFLLLESLHWFATANRSGNVAYFEATPADRQERMRQALATWAPPDFAEHFEVGMQGWAGTGTGSLVALDAWSAAHDDANTRWLWRLAAGLRPTIVALVS